MKSEEVSITLDKFNIAKTDIAVLREAGRLLDGEIESFVNDFYIWLRDREEYQFYFADAPAMLARVQKLQASHWRSLFNAGLDDDYFTSRRHIGAVHARIDLPNDIYCAGTSMSGRMMIERLRSLKPLPANVDAMVVVLTKLIDSVAAIRGARILVVEDNDLNQQVAGGLLGEAGFVVEFAENGQIAVNKVRGATQPWDIVLMDMHMPVMDGLEATVEIRKTFPASSLPIVAMTAKG